MMKKDRSWLRYAAVVGLLATAPTIASAYIDPGNGAYIVQALFTIVATLLFYLRHPVRTAKNIWHHIRHGRSTDESAPPEISPESPKTDDARSV